MADYTENSRVAGDPPPTYTTSAGQPPLPTYQDVERDAPPPSYESLYGRAKAIKAESSGNVDFVKKVIMFLAGTIGFTIFLGVMLAVPIAMIIIGSRYLHDCPAERYIPIYLVVAGVFGVVRNSITIVKRCCQRNQDENEEEDRKKVNPLETLIDCFMFAWFIAGNVWIYRTHGEFSTTAGDADFCDPTLYWFAFWITTAVYILLGCCCCCCCFCGLFAMCLDSGEK